MNSGTMARIGSIANIVGRLRQESSAFLLCDIQEKFRPHIHAMPSVIHVANTMVKASEKLQIPLIVTEHYPKGLGRTVKDLDISKAKVFEKTKFSMITPEVEKALGSVESVVLFGIEAHVCVLQTALDLVERGIDVHVVVDGTSSMRQFDRLTAFTRMKEVGVYMTTCESVLFQIMREATHPNFKEISEICKIHAQAKVDPHLPNSSL